MLHLRIPWILHCVGPHVGSQQMTFNLTLGKGQVPVQTISKNLHLKEIWIQSRKGPGLTVASLSLLEYQEVCGPARGSSRLSYSRASHEALEGNGLTLKGGKSQNHPSTEQSESILLGSLR